MYGEKYEKNTKKNVPLCLFNYRVENGSDEMRAGGSRERITSLQTITRFSWHFSRESEDLIGEWLRDAVIIHFAEIFVPRFLVPHVTVFIVDRKASFAFSKLCFGKLSFSPSDPCITFSHTLSTSNRLFIDTRQKPRTNPFLESSDLFSSRFVSFFDAANVTLSRRRIT